MKRSSYDIRNNILMIVKEETMKYSHLERRLHTSYRTVRRHCDELEKEGMVKIHKIDKDPANGSESFEVEITEHGLKTLKNMKS
jgi:predicted transcriptional regulator